MDAAASDRHEKILRRTRTIARVEKARPDLICIVAPAGYGKTTFIAQLGLQSAITCECAGIADMRDLGRRMFAAIARFEPQQHDAVAPLAIALTSAQNDEEAIAAVLQAWDRASDAHWVVFENAEALVGDDASMMLLSRLLSTRNNRRIVLCSRSALPLRLHTVATVTRILRIGASELRFDQAELERLFEHLHSTQGDVAQHVAVRTNGWPIAAQALRALAVRGELDDVLARYENVAFEDLYEYVSDEVLSMLHDAEFDALIVCAALGRAVSADIRALLGPQAIDYMARAARESPFVIQSAPGVFQVHPLLQATIRATHASACTERLRQLAAAHAAKADHLAEARVYLELGEQAAAAAALERMALNHLNEPIAPELVHLVSRIDASLLLDYPTLWASTSMYRPLLFDHQRQFRDAQIVWQRNQHAAMPVFANVASAYLAAALASLGEFDAAMQAISVFRDRVACAPDYPIAQLTLQAWEAFVAAMRGKHERALDIWARLEPVHVHIDAQYAMSLYDIAARIARAHGDRSTELHALALASDAAHRCGISLVRAVVMMDRVFGAWFAGEDIGEELVALEAAVDAMVEPGTRFFIACARGKRSEPFTGCEALKVRAYGHLIAVSFSESGSEALECARSALRDATASANTFLVILSHAALAVLEPARRQTHIRNAYAAAEGFESPELYAALRKIELRSTDCGMLEAFVTQMLSRRKTAGLCVSAIERRVTSNSENAAISGRELELLCLLSVERRPMSLSDIARRLYAEREPEAARNVIKVVIHRIREKLGAAAILYTQSGYAVGAGIRSDFWETENQLRHIVPSIDRQALQAQTALLQTLASKIFSAAQAHGSRKWEWFSPRISQMLDMLQSQIARFGASLLAQGASEEARNLAGLAIAADPCDESARELAIRAHIMAGDRPAALRELRQYKQALEKELDTVPSPHLVRLVEGAA